MKWWIIVLANNRVKKGNGLSRYGIVYLSFWKLLILNKIRQKDDLRNELVAHHISGFL